MIKKKDSHLKRYGLSDYNKPKRTPNHATKSHIVAVKKNGRIKIIRFGQQGIKGAGKYRPGESKKITARRKSFKSRFQRLIAKNDPFSAIYWSNKVKW
jgi:predicted ATP-dependent Lon-type protease